MSHVFIQNGSESGDVGTWFNEVMELRRKAGEYKQRALGTHFSRSHVGQLFAQQAELWNEEDDAASQLAEALDLSVFSGSQRGSQRGSTARRWVLWELFYFAFA